MEENYPEEVFEAVKELLP